jgi:glucose-induced degradation protein 8
MDYLVIEGYQSAAEQFSHEASVDPPVELGSIESRMDIRDFLSFPYLYRIIPFHAPR